MFFSIPFGSALGSLTLFMHFTFWSVNCALNFTFRFSVAARNVLLLSVFLWTAIYKRKLFECKGHMASSQAKKIFTDPCGDANGMCRTSEIPKKIPFTQKNLLRKGKKSHHKWKKKQAGCMWNKSIRLTPYSICLSSIIGQHLWCKYFCFPLRSMAKSQYTICAGVAVASLRKRFTEPSNLMRK